MTPEQAGALRAPFPPDKVNKLPRVSCGACRDSREKVCATHAKSKCKECESWITTAHIHLDFVGHANVTDRFLEVDPAWTWEPFALDGQGLPALDGNGGMWIRLTIAGVTRIGYGDADGKKGPNAVKEAIGDALRNAGLRFGVALDLWRKEAAVEETDRRGAESWESARPSGEPSGLAVDLFADIMGAETEETLREAWEAVDTARTAGWITRREAEQLTAHVRKRKDELAQKEANGDSTGDGDGSSAEPGPAGKGAGPDGESPGDGGPGRDGEDGGPRPGVQPRVHRGAGVDRGAQAPRDDRNAPAAVGG